MQDEDRQIIGQPEQPETLLDQLAEKRKLVAETKEADIPLPGYDRNPPLLFARYRLLDGPEIDKLVQNVRLQHRNRWDRALHAAVATFVQACVGIYFDKGDGIREPLTVGGHPVMGFTRELAEGLQFADSLEDPDDPRQVVFGLFGNNDVMITQHNYLLNRWMGDTSLEVSRELFEEGNL